MDQGNWKGLWLTLPLCLAVLIPLYVQLTAQEDAGPVQLQAPASQGGAPADQRRLGTPANPIPDSDHPEAPWSDPASKSHLNDLSDVYSLSSVVQTELPILDGVIEPYVVVDVRSSEKGRIESIAVERGDYVERGQEIVRLDSSVERANVAVAEARAHMTGELRSRQATDALGRRRQRRMEKLFHRDAISLDIQDEVETEALVAKHELKAARERREVALQELQRARQQLQRRIIHSPLSGYVVDRHMAPGEVVDEEVILSVAQVDPLLVEVIAPSRLYGQIEAGDLAEVVPELPAGARYEAEVAIVDRLIDGASGTFRVRLELPNPDHTIPSGLRCLVRLKPDTEVAGSDNEDMSIGNAVTVEDPTTSGDAAEVPAPGDEISRRTVPAAPEPHAAGP